VKAAASYTDRAWCLRRAAALQPQVPPPADTWPARGRRTARQSTLFTASLIDPLDLRTPTNDICERAPAHVGNELSLQETPYILLTVRKIIIQLASVVRWSLRLTGRFLRLGTVVANRGSTRGAIMLHQAQRRPWWQGQVQYFGGVRVDARPSTGCRRNHIAFRELRALRSGTAAQQFEVFSLARASHVDKLAADGLAPVI
jgi:hypothetical protein